jgi:hypothetical protein
VLGLALASAVLSCSTERRERAPDAEHKRGARDWSMVQAEIYFAALDTLLTRRFASDTIWHVVDAIYWWPLAVRLPQVRLEDTPVGLPVVGRENGRTIDLVSFQDGVAPDGRPRFAGPIMVLGPIDMLGENDALFRVNLYLGPNGQELRRMRCRLVDGKWRVVEAAPEVST